MGNNIKNILLTGASGFLGTHIKKYLYGCPNQWRIFLINSRDEFENFEEKFANQKIDIIIHAGFSIDFQKPNSDDSSKNIENTRRVLKFSEKRGASYAIFLSAAGTLGVSRNNQARNEGHFGKTDPEFIDYLNTQYIQDKIACQKIVDNLPFPAVTLYLTTVYGKLMDPNVVDRLKGLCGINPIIVYPPGGSSFLDLRDFLNALDLILLKKPTGGMVLSSGNILFSGLYRAVLDFYKLRRKKLMIPIPAKAKVIFDLNCIRKLLSLKNTSVLKTGFGYKYYSTYKAQSLIGWSPKHTINDSLKETLADPISLPGN
jgi:nucleoside-diphosphate-sugar epimerase